MASKKSSKRTALGRGLGALLSDSSSFEADIPRKAPQLAGKSIDEIQIEKIKTNPFQPRTDFDKDSLNALAESIKNQGIIQPITVREMSDGTFQLISGERRLQASRISGLDTIPAFVRKANDTQMLEMALIENTQREDLNAMEIALSYQRLLDECNLNQEELAQRVSKDRSTITNYLRLLKLPPDIQAGLRDKKISMGHARALITINNVEAQLLIYKKIISDDLSVRKVEELARLLNKRSDSKESKKGKSKDGDIVRIESKLSSFFGTKIEIDHKGKSGTIKIPYLSADDLERILELLNVR
jgi:ParB family chromosome partitioning protein